MQRQTTCTVLALLVGALAVPTVIPAAAAQEEIVLSTYPRIAFYTSAPPQLARSMRKAVVKVCRTSTPIAWLCGSGPIYFLRPVTVGGTQFQTGYVCSGESTLKYYPPDMVGKISDCTAVSYDAHTRMHFIVPTSEAKK